MDNFRTGGSVSIYCWNAGVSLIRSIPSFLRAQEGRRTKRFKG
jgi:hypothetical protein